ncbi:MAG: YgaP-like transmembrane domain [Candidatus Methylomirabilia bacterium]
MRQNVGTVERATRIAVGIVLLVPVMGLTLRKR